MGRLVHNLIGFGFLIAEWRVLKADMADSSNGNQALIIKEQALTDQETW